MVVPKYLWRFHICKYGLLSSKKFVWWKPQTFYISKRSNMKGNRFQNSKSLWKCLKQWWEGGGAKPTKSFCRHFKIAYFISIFSKTVTPFLPCSDANHMFRLTVGLSTVRSSLRWYILRTPAQERLPISSAQIECLFVANS